MKAYQAIIFFVIGFAVGSGCLAWHSTLHFKSHEEDYIKQLDNAKAVHIADSLWNEFLQDSLSHQIAQRDTVLVPKIKHHYDTIYLSIDTLSNDSAGKLLTDLIRQHINKRSY